MEKLDSFLEHHPSDSMSADLHVPIVHTEETQTQPGENHPSDSMSVDLHVPIVHTIETQAQPEEHHPSDSVSVNPHVPIVVHTKETQTQPEYALVSEKVSNSKIVTELHQGNSEAFEKIKNTELTMEGVMLEQKDEINVVANETQNLKTLEDVDKNIEEEIAHPLQETKSTLASKKGEEPSSTAENIVLNVNGSTDVKLEDTLLAEQKVSSFQTVFSVCLFSCRLNI